MSALDNRLTNCQTLDMAKADEAVKVCECGEPEDGGEFGWFDTDNEGTVCNACGAHVTK